MLGISFWLLLVFVLLHGHGGGTKAASTRTTDTITDDELLSQFIDTPFYGQHVGVAYADLNGDGAVDLLFAAGRHWVDQSYALINLGPKYDRRVDGELEFVGVRFSDALPVGPPGSYYQIDVAPSIRSSGSKSRSTVLLVGGTCHHEVTNSFGSCRKGENTPARVVEVSMNKRAGCSVHYPGVPCRLQWRETWTDPDPKGDRNGGFAKFNDDDAAATKSNASPSIVLVGQGGVEVYDHVRASNVLRNRSTSDRRHRASTEYSFSFRLRPPKKTDPRSDFARFAGFAAGRSPAVGGIVAAGRRSDFDPPQRDGNGNVVGINELVFRDARSNEFRSILIPPTASGEPYPGNSSYSLQTTNYAFDDVNGDGVEDLLEATFLYGSQRVSGYPLPQRIHFLDKKARVTDTLIVLESEEGDAGRSVTTGQIFSESSLPDVVYGSADGVVTLFANLGVDKRTGEFRGLEKRHQLSVGTHDCEVRDVAVVPLVKNDRGGRGRRQEFRELLTGYLNRANKHNHEHHGKVHHLKRHSETLQGKGWVGIVCAVTCGYEHPEKAQNHVFYIENDSI